MTMVDVTYAEGEDGGIMSQKAIDYLQDKGREDEINWVTEGFEIMQDDDSKDDFKTIMGGNDFYDITGDSVVTHGMTSEQAIHEKKGGFAEAAFFGINRINQKVNENAIREKFRVEMDAVNNNLRLSEKQKNFTLQLLERTMDNEISAIGRVPMNDVDYGKGDGVK